MKAKIKSIAAIICAAAMVFSMAITAFAGESGEIDLETVYKMAQKALDQQEIQNVMSRHVMYHCYGLHADEMEAIWCNEPENRATASFGMNQGYWVGYDNVWDAYVVSHDSTWLSSATAYCEENGIDVSGMTDEEILDIYGGVGQLLMHCTTTGMIEVAEDGQTARCFWYSPGMVKETGQAASAIWEAYGVDMVKENGEWKIWHIHMFTDFTGEFFVNLGGVGEAAALDSSGAEGTGESADAESADAESADAESADVEAAGESSGDSSGDSAGSSASVSAEGGEAAALSSDITFISKNDYSTYTTDRLRSDMELLLPAPYDTWNFADPSYGPTEEECIALGIDLDAWYAAHSN